MIRILEQGVRLLERLAEDQYRRSVPNALGASIGSHYRHSLEHFEALLTPGGTDLIDYDARKRDAKVETDPAAARTRTEFLLERAEALEPDRLGDPVQVRCSVGADSESPVVPSTFGREVMYAVIHAVHHYAIIRMMCGALEVGLPEGFGVAPSTLQYRKALADRG